MPLVTPEINFGTENLTKLQAEDESLGRATEFTEQKDNTEFQLQRGLHYRIKANRQGNERKQLALSDIGS